MKLQINLSREELKKEWNRIHLLRIQFWTLHTTIKDIRNNWTLKWFKNVNLNFKILLIHQISEWKFSQKEKQTTKLRKNLPLKNVVNSLVVSNTSAIHDRFAGAFINCNSTPAHPNSNINPSTDPIVWTDRNFIFECSVGNEISLSM